MTAIGCANDRTPQRHDSVSALPVENDMIAGGKESFESIAKTDHLPTEFFCCEHDSAQNRVQTWAITTTGQNTNPWLHLRDNGIRAFLCFGNTAASSPLIVELPAALHKAR